MALVLGLQIGDRFYVGDTKVTLEKVFKPSRFKLRVEKSWADELIEVTENPTELMPGIMVRAGPGNPNMVKVAIEAPRSVRILRGKLYENPPKGA